MSVSPKSDFAPEMTLPSRHVWIASTDTGITGWPASSSRSSSRPLGRSLRDLYDLGIAALGESADQ